MMSRRRRSLPGNQRGFVLIALVALLVMGGLYFFISNLTPEAIEARRQAKTQNALVQAREALIGYAVQYREQQIATGDPAAMYGHLPLPDFGETVNLNGNILNQPCTSEGCAKINPAGIAGSTVIIGRFPWKTVGVEPLRDGHGECLWYAVSATHRAVSSTAGTMNWDTLAVPDVVIGSGSATLAAVNEHQRPIAVIFSAGAAFSNGRASSNDAPECRGNYDVAHYVDPALNNAQRSLPVTSDLLFETLRRSATRPSPDIPSRPPSFRDDIGDMLDRMTVCARDQIAAGSIAANAKVADACSSAIDAFGPRGYLTNYRDQVFVAKCPACQVTVDSVLAPSCAGALLFGNQRGNGQNRRIPTEIADPANYLEGDNLTSFNSSGNIYAGSGKLMPVTAQSLEQDIVRCIPAGTSLTVVAPTVTATAGNIQLASYAPATGLLTLGSAAINSNYGASAAALYACAWTPEAQAGGSGFRSYFRFRIRKVGEGFTFAVIDGDRNANDPVGNGIDDDGNGIIDDGDVCGAARQHLGYSGNNAGTRYIEAPKLAIEFDTARQANFSEAGSTLSNGRNDPCYTTSCGGQGLDNSSHVAVVYWGYGAADATVPVTLPQQDDNVHGFPVPPDASARPAPRNPAAVLPYVAPPPFPDLTAAPGLAPLDRMGGTTGAFREFHARLELTRNFTAPTDAKNGLTSVQVQFWIEPHPAANISAMSYNAGSPPTLTVTTSSVHNLNTGDTVVIKDAVPTGFNGEYSITAIDANNFTAVLPAGAADPGRYISAITWADIDGSADLATVTSANHGLNTGDSVTIAGALPTEYNGTRTVTRIDANSYYFDLELDYEPGNLVAAVAAAKALTPRAVALANTTRPMSLLDATAKPFVSDTATIYDEQKGACAASAPLCPSGQSCGSDNMCYRPSFRNLRLGFTVAERPTTSLTTARGQLIEIRDRATTWLP